jgi:hypothetical protein
MNLPYLCNVQAEDLDTLVVMQEDSLELDTVASSIQTQVEEPTVSLFQEHQLEPKGKLEPIERTEIGSDFVFFILVICGGIILYLQRNSDNIFRSVFNASFDINQALKDARVENSQRTRNLFILQTLGFICITLFLTGSIQELVPLNINLENTFFSLLGILVAFVLIKKIILWLLAAIFELHEEFRAFVFNLNILQSVAGLVLLPVCLFLYYSPIQNSYWIVYIGLLFGAFFYLKVLQRGFMISMRSQSISTLHLFYYLCALEILPAFILLRVAISMG